MHFEDLASFLQMGGYGLFVWISFASAALSLGLIWFGAFISKQQLFKKILKEQARQVRIQAAKKTQSGNGDNI